MEKADDLLERHFGKLYALVLIGAAAAYLVLCLDSSVWADEAYTFAMLRHSYTEIWSITAADVHPPLYYVLAKLTTGLFGYSMLSVRCFSAVQYLLLLALGGWQGRRLFGARTALAFMAVFFLYPFGQTYASEARMYSLAALCVFGCALYAVRAHRFGARGDWVGLALFGIGAAYTHYFALVSVGIIYLLLLAALLRGHKNVRAWLCCVGASIAAYLPWLGSFLSQLAYKVSNEYWISPITLSTVISDLQTLLSANGFATFVVFAAAAAAAGVIYCVGKRLWLPLCALAVPVLTAGVGIAASLAVRPVYVVRYLAPCVPLIAFAAAYVLGKLKCREALGAALALIVMGGLSDYAIALTGLMGSESGQLDASFVAQYADADAYIVYSGADSAVISHVSQVLSYYDGETPIYLPETLGADNPYENRYSLSALDTAQYDTLVVLATPGETPDAEWTQDYTATYEGTVQQQYNTEDVWLLQRDPG